MVLPETAFIQVLGPRTSNSMSVKAFRRSISSHPSKGGRLIKEEICYKEVSDPLHVPIREGEVRCLAGMPVEIERAAVSVGDIRPWPTGQQLLLTCGKMVPRIPSAARPEAAIANEYDWSSDVCQAYAIRFRLC